MKSINELIERYNAVRQEEKVRLENERQERAEKEAARMRETYKYYLEEINNKIEEAVESGKKEITYMYHTSTNDARYVYLDINGQPQSSSAIDVITAILEYDGYIVEIDGNFLQISLPIDH